MSHALRKLQWIGLALFALSACLPAFPFRVGTPNLPTFLQPGDAGVVLIGPPGEQRVPALEVVRSAQESLSGKGDPFWQRRPLYAYALLAIWLSALWLARSSRRVAGGMLWIVSLAVIVLEAAYLKTDYRAFLPGVLGPLETGVVWCAVVAILTWRRKADRRPDAFEATIGAQALLGVVHGLTLPSTYARDMIGNAPFADVMSAIGEVFAPGFWIGLLGLILAALPTYVGRRRYDVPQADAGVTASRSPG